jgi:hypothetical protein
VVQDQHAEEPVAMVSIQKSIIIAVGLLAAMAGTGWAGSEAEYAIGSDDVERISGVAQAAATTALSLSRNEMVAKLPQSHGGSAVSDGIESTWQTTLPGSIGSDGVESTWQAVQPVSIGSDGVETAWHMIQPASIGSDGYERSAYSGPRQADSW